VGKDKSQEYIMSISQQITDLALVSQPEGRLILEELSLVLLKYSPEYQRDQLLEALQAGDYKKSDIHQLIDDFQVATAQHRKPPPRRYQSFKTDIKRYFELSHVYVDLDQPETVISFVERYNDIFSTPKRYCSHIMLGCAKKGCGGKFTSLDQFLCTECGTPRDLCRRPPAGNGRCVGIGHKGAIVSGPLNDRFTTPGRAKIYGESLQGELQEMYVEAVTDPEYLSVAPEIGALAARSAELMRDIGDTDYVAVAAKTRQAIKALKKSAKDDDIHGMLFAADEIEEQLTAVADDKRRWDEIAALSGRLGRLSESERKRIIEAQKVITVQEMFTIQQETLTQIRDAFAIVASGVVKWIDRGKEVDQPHLRQYMLRTLHKVMQGDLDLEKSLKDDQPLIIEASVDGSART
jgi:hypothetical protein